MHEALGLKGLILDMMVTLRSPKTIMPWLSGIALVLCLVLYVIHFARLRKRKRSVPSHPLNAEWAGIAREMIRHENELMNHRLTWLLTAEGLLFAALGLALPEDGGPAKRQLIEILSFVGVMLAASGSIVLDAADAAIVRWSPRVPKTETDVIGYRGVPLLWVFCPWRIYPPMFICAWYMVSQI